MGDLNYQRTVIAYHGCDESVVNVILLGGETLQPSQNEYDWLGRGIYFWEHGPRRAGEWAGWRKRAGQRIRKPAVLGAIVHLGNCFDLLDTANTRLLAESYPLYASACWEEGIPIPQNRSAPGERTGDLVLRYLDCAVINWCLTYLERRRRVRFHTVRCAFSEGTPVFSGSKILAKSHIQIAVRESPAIVGFFKPSVDNLQA